MNDDDPLIEFDPTDVAFTTLARLLAMMRLSAYIMAIFGLTLGTLILLGGPHRFSAVAYSASLVIPGAPATWGWTMLVSSVIAFVGVKNRMYRIGMWGMGMCGVWSMAFGIAFLVSAIQFEDANLTAIAAYTTLGTLFLLMASAQRILAKTLPTKDVTSDAGS